ncbi:MAG TPA: metallophosphoesterase [Coriobacteriia bacterium]|jgi:predicted phosphodiesterase
MRALSWNDILPQTPSRRTPAAPPPLHVVPAPAPRIRLGLFALTMAACVTAGLLAFALFAHSTFEVGPATVSVGAQPAVKGSTTLDVPPFGAVSAGTHTAPLAIRASLREVDITRLQSLALSGVPGTRTIDAYKAQATRGAENAAGKGLMAALAAAAFVGWALRRDWRATLAGGVLGLAVPALMVSSAVLGFDSTAFRDPTYTGAMRYAPSLIGLVQGRIERVGNLQKQVEDAVRQMNAYYSHPQSFSAGGAMPHTFRVLQVSDLHLDPVGFKLESELADVFHASVVLDCGDADDYGTPIEGSAIKSFLDTRVPRVFIPGNHESPAVVRAIDSMPNVTVVESGTVTVDGLTIFGLADPMSRKDAWKPNVEQTTIEAQAAADALAAAEASGTPKPQIVATHNPLGLQPFADLAPLLVAGHTHVPDLGRIGSSWYLNSGTVGGVDFAKLYSDPSIAHGASILYYTETLPRRLVAIDQISVWGRTDQSSLKRTVVDPALLDQLMKQPAAKPAAAKAAHPRPAVKKR